MYRIVNPRKQQTFRAIYSNYIIILSNPYIDVLTFTAAGNIRQQRMFSCTTPALGGNYYLNATDGAVRFQEVSEVNDL